MKYFVTKERLFFSSIHKMGEIKDFQQLYAYMFNPVQARRIGMTDFTSTCDFSRHRINTKAPLKTIGSAMKAFLQLFRDLLMSLVGM